MKGWIIVRTQEVLTSDDVSEEMLREEIADAGELVERSKRDHEGAITVVIVRDELQVAGADVAFRRAGDTAECAPVTDRVEISDEAPTSPSVAPATPPSARLHVTRNVNREGSDARGGSPCEGCGEPIIRAPGQRGRLPSRHPGCMSQTKKTKIAAQRRARAKVSGSSGTSGAAQPVPAVSRAAITVNDSILAACEREGCGAPLELREKIVACNEYEGGVWKRVVKMHLACYDTLGRPYGAPAGWKERFDAGVDRSVRRTWDRTCRECAEPFAAANPQAQRCPGCRKKAIA